MSDASPLLIELNGTSVSFSPGVTLATVVAGQDCDPLSIATAVNGAFVARQARQAHALADGDIVQFFSPMVGG